MKETNENIFIISYHWLYALVNVHYALSNILPVFIFLLWFFFRSLCFHIKNTETMNIIYSKIKNDFYNTCDDEMRPLGIIINRPTYKSYWIPSYVIYRPVYDRFMCVYTTNWYMKNVLLEEENRTIVKSELSVIPDKKQDESAKIMKCLYRTGDSSYIRWKSRKISIPFYRFNNYQAHMFRKTMEFYNENNYVVTFIDGDIGVGKTCFAYLMANELSATFVDSFNPTDPSDSFDNLYTSTEHSSVKPLVLLMDEVEIILKQIHNGIPQHKNYIIHMRNKVHWNAFLDKIQLGTYPNLILIMCSNYSREKISHDLDPSYLRDGRVNLYFHMKNKLI